MSDWRTIGSRDSAGMGAPAAQQRADQQTAAIPHRETLSALGEEETPLPAAVQQPRRRWRRLLMMVLTVLAAQYTITSIIVGVSVAATLRYFVTPQIVAKFEALAIALKR
jgi:hypothetical protein